MQESYSKSLQEFQNAKNNKSKPRINLNYKPNLSWMTKWAVHSQLKQPDFIIGAALEDELREVCRLYQQHQMKFAKFTQGFCYVRTYTESYDLIENCILQ